MIHNVLNTNAEHKFKMTVLWKFYSACQKITSEAIHKTIESIVHTCNFLDTHCIKSIVMKWQFLLSIKIKGPENTLKEIKIENIYLKTFFVKRSITQFYTPICNTKVQHKICMNIIYSFSFLLIPLSVKYH